MKLVVPPALPLEGGKIWPLSVPAHRLLAEAELIPKNTELLNGVIYRTN